MSSEMSLSGGPRVEKHGFAGPINNVLIGVVLDIFLFAVTALGSFLAQAGDRPVSAALILLVGVIAIGAHSGLARGFVTALIASAFYSFFIRAPAYEFTAYSADDLIPIIAFNLSAMLSGTLAGRLNDRAKAAEDAETRNALLLSISDGLQKALSLDDVLASVRVILPFRGIAQVELYEIDGRRPIPVGQQALYQKAVGALVDGETASVLENDHAIFLLGDIADPIGAVVFAFDAPRPVRHDAQEMMGVANLLRLSFERCTLLDQVSEARAVKRSEDLKSAILSSLSHDLRTPLTAIEAAATTIKSLGAQLTDEDTGALLDTICEQSRKLNRYTSNLIDMGRLQTGISEESLQQVDIAEILGHAIASIRFAYPQEKIAKEFTRQNLTVKASPSMLEQLFFNIIENAIVHGTSAKGCKVSLSYREGRAMVEIADFGPGIAPTEQARVFERFYQVAPKGSGGTGLGMHISKGFAEAFGGEVSLASPHESGCGTKLIIALPLLDFRDQAAEL